MQAENVFYLKLSDLTVEMHSHFGYSERHCKNYISKDASAPHIVAMVSQDQIEAENQIEGGALSDGYCEDICLYREIAEQLPHYDRLVFHGAAVESGGVGYIFTAPSGTGKTTHVNLWLDRFGDKVRIINGDKPILRLDGDRATVHSTPWAGKEGLENNISAPLGAIVLLHRSSENRITRITPSEHFAELVKQFYLPRKVDMKLKTLDIIDQLLSGVPVYLLECNISYEAAELSFNTLTMK